MVVQKAIDLNKPIAKGDDKITLDVSPLTTDLSEAALILHGDYYRQLQGDFIKSIFWNRMSVSLTILVLSVYLYYSCHEYVEQCNTIKEFIALVYKSRALKADLIMVFPVLAGVLGTIGLLSLFVTDEFKIISEKMITTKYMEHLFGFNLYDFSKINPDDSNKKVQPVLQKGNNTGLINYNGEPIGIITVKPLVSNDNKLNIKITGLSVRKAFSKFDFEPILLDWAIKRSKDISKELNHKGKVTLLVDNYCFNKALEKTLIDYNFSKIESSFNFNPTEENTSVLNHLFNKTFNITKDTFGLNI